MKTAMKYLAVFALTLMIPLNTASAVGEDISDLKRLITAFEDISMDSQDLAFFLATHNFDAVPRDGYVKLNLLGKVYRLIPNGNKPGLCDIEPEDDI